MTCKIHTSIISDTNTEMGCNSNVKGDCEHPGMFLKKIPSRIAASASSEAK